MIKKNGNKRVLRIRSVEINVTALIICLLAADVVIAGVMLFGCSGKKPDSPAGPVLTAIPASTPVPSSPADVSKEPASDASHDHPLLNVKYEKEAFQPVVDGLSGFSSAWHTSGDNTGYVEVSSIYDTIQATVYTPGSSPTSAMVSQEGIPFESGKNYAVCVHVSSPAGGSLNIVASNADTGAEFARGSVNLTPDLTYYELPFTASGTTYNGRVAFELGGGMVPANAVVTINGIRILGEDDNAAVRANQIGYVSTDQKRCTFIYKCGDLFDLVNAETKEIVFCGPIVYGRDNGDTGEYDYYGDFSTFREPGTYYIRSQNGLVSHPFVIARDPYTDLRNSALKMLSYQRCGTYLGEWAGGLAHAECHNRPANLVYTDSMFDLSGGWHDAGDYGRYVKTGAKAVNDLMLAYMTAPELFGDDTGGPDSGNGIPDILDEARYEMEWLLKMQEEGGSVFSKVVTQSFPDDTVAPENDTAVLFVIGADTISTADAGGAYAIASIVFRDVDSDFADRCLDAAEKAHRYLRGHPDVTYSMNPSDFSAGQYLDSDDKDARFTLEMALYAATGETDYLEDAQDLYNDEEFNVINGVTWDKNGGYGAYLFLACSDGEKEDQGFYEKIRDDLKSMADNLLSQAEGNSYNTVNGLYAWGSNSVTANYGILLAMAYDFTGEQAYLQTAVEQLNYLLGKNSLDMCFVSGYGTFSPKNQHNRLALSKGTLMTGAMSGGPDASREDNVTQALPQDLPVAKIYADNKNSYSTNEIAIYYNSALLYLLTAVY